MMGPTILIPGCRVWLPSEPDLVATLGVDIYGGQEAGLRGVGVDPSHGVQAPAVLGLKNFLLCQGLHRVTGALLFGHNERGDAEQALLGVQQASQDAAALHASPGVGLGIAACESVQDRK